MPQGQLGGTRLSPSTPSLCIRAVFIKQHLISAVVNPVTPRAAQLANQRCFALFIAMLLGQRR